MKSPSTKRRRWSLHPRTNQHSHPNPSWSLSLNWRSKSSSRNRCSLRHSSNSKKSSKSLRRRNNRMRTTKNHRHEPHSRRTVRRRDLRASRRGPEGRCSGGKLLPPERPCSSVRKTCGLCYTSVALKESANRRLCPREAEAFPRGNGIRRVQLFYFFDSFS